MEPFYKIFIPIMFTLFGLILGSFTTCYTYRYINHIPLLSKKRSFCPNCNHELAWYDNIPLFSYIFLGGKCRYCKKKISIRYPLIELTMTIIFVLVYLKFFYFNSCMIYTFTILNLVDAIIVSLILMFLFNVFIIDYETMEIPFRVNIAVALLAIIYYVIHAIILKDYLLLNLIGLGVALIMFISIYLIGTYALKKELIGLGDVILISSLSLVFGIFNLVVFLFIASLLATIVEMIKEHKSKEKKQPFAFGPYLALSALVTFSFYDILDSYLLTFF